MKEGSFHVKVAVRIRPVLNHDRIGKVVVIPLRADNSATKKKKHIIRVLDPDKTHPGRKQEIDYLRLDYVREREFEFDQVFGPCHDTNFVFKASVQPMVKYVLDGQNVTIFAYGQTGSGKTYTMLGHSDRENGIMRLTLEHLFSCLNMKNTERATCHLSFVELYNEDLRDLLSEKASPPTLELREDPTKGPVIIGATQVPVSDVNAVVDLLRSGNDKRTQEPTCANEQSSRSHAVLQIVCLLDNDDKEAEFGFEDENLDHNELSPTTTPTNGVLKRQRKKGAGVQRTSKLSIIDLAGSERAAETHNRGIRLTEGARINRSLLALGNVINGLRANQNNGGPKQYVNFRDSKLTRLLKDSLGGNCRTLMLAHASPAMSSYEETLNTLKYAQRTRAIKNAVRENIYRRPLVLPPAVKKAQSPQAKTIKSEDQLPVLALKVMPKPVSERKSGLGRAREEVLAQVREAIELRSRIEQIELELNREDSSDPFSYISRALLAPDKVYRHPGQEPQRIRAKAQRECEALKRAVKRDLPQRREEELLEQLNSIGNELPTEEVLRDSGQQEALIDAEMNVVGRELERLEQLVSRKHVDPRSKSIHEDALNKLHLQVRQRNEIIRRLLTELKASESALSLNDLLTSPTFMPEAIRHAKHHHLPPSDFGVQWKALPPLPRPGDKSMAPAIQGNFARARPDLAPRRHHHYYDLRNGRNPMNRDSGFQATTQTTPPLRWRR